MIYSYILPHTLILTLYIAPFYDTSPIYCPLRWHIPYICPVLLPTMIYPLYMAKYCTNFWKLIPGTNFGTGYGFSYRIRTGLVLGTDFSTRFVPGRYWVYWPVLPPYYDIFPIYFPLLWYIRYILLHTMIYSYILPHMTKFCPRTMIYPLYMPSIAPTMIYPLYIVPYYDISPIYCPYIDPYYDISPLYAQYCTYYDIPPIYVLTHAMIYPLYLAPYYNISPKYAQYCPLLWYIPYILPLLWYIP